MTESIYLIYKHTSPSGKSYIGLTKDYERRCQQHQVENSGCPLFAAAIKKYGWDNFTHELLIEHISLKEANALEIHYIAEHQAFGPNGYNLTEGGGGQSGRQASDETKTKLSSARRDRITTDVTKAKMSAARKGKARSDESKANQSAATRSIPKSAEHKAKISMAIKGRSRTEETKAKISATLKKRWLLAE
jgi:group I intron endonuclease